jgi:ChrB-like protein
MSGDPGPDRWVFLLAQLPSSPSSARVALWRRLRSGGAARLLNGAWALPYSAAHEGFFEELRETVAAQGGKGVVLTVSDSSSGTDAKLIEQFRADRAREYDEFDERCDAFLAELAKETKARKFTFAELEEEEEDLDKLRHWLAKIAARDFFPGDRLTRARELAALCEHALRDFSRAVYKESGAQEWRAPVDSPIQRSNRGSKA